MRLALRLANFIQPGVECAAMQIGFIERRVPSLRQRPDVVAQGTDGFRALFRLFENQAHNRLVAFRNDNLLAAQHFLNQAREMRLGLVDGDLSHASNLVIKVSHVKIVAGFQTPRFLPHSYTTLPITSRCSKRMPLFALERHRDEPALHAMEFVIRLVLAR